MKVYQMPPEYHIFEREDKYLIFDPVNFVWFVTDHIGKLTVSALAEFKTAEGAANQVAVALSPTYRTDEVEAYVAQYISHLLGIGFLHEGEYKKQAWGSGILKTPQTLYLHLTNKCNLKCPYCYNQEHRDQLIQIGRSSEEGLMKVEGKTEQFLRIIDEAAELGFNEVKLTGGEALLNKDALVLAARAKQHGMRVNLLTNAVLVTKKMAEQIVQVVDSVSISLDSDKPDEHDIVRGKGTHRKVLEAIRMLREAGLKYLHLNAVITPVNMSSVGDFMEYAIHTLGAEQISYAGSDMNVEDPSGKWGAANYLLNQEQQEHVYAQSSAFHKKHNKDAGPIPRSQLWRRQCGVGNGLISVDPNGDVYPCQTLHHPEFLCGNAFQSGLRTILENSEVIKKSKNAAVDILPECKTCPVRYVCAGGCRSEAYSREGDFLARNRTMCPIYFKSAVDQLWAAAKMPLGNTPVQQHSCEPMQMCPQ